MPAIGMIAIAAVHRSARAHRGLRRAVLTTNPPITNASMATMPAMRSTNSTTLRMVCFVASR